MTTLQYAIECDFDRDYSRLHIQRMDTRETDQQFGDRLDELMQGHERYGVRGQSALAKDSGVPQPTISRILKNKSAPEMETVARLAVVFNVTCEWLLTGRGPKYVRLMRIEDSENPDENVSRELSTEEISTLISRLQDLQTQVSALLTFAKGIPSISGDPKRSDDMYISSVRANTAAAAKLLGKDSGGKKHGKHRDQPGGNKTG